MLFFNESLELLSVVAPAAAQQVTQVQLNDEQRAALQLVLSQVTPLPPLTRPRLVTYSPILPSGAAAQGGHRDAQGAGGGRGGGGGGGGGGDACQLAGRERLWLPGPEPAPAP